MNGMKECISIMKKTQLINGISYHITNPDDIIQKNLIEGKQWNNWAYKTCNKLQKQYGLKHLVNIGSHIGTVALPLSFVFEKVSCVEPFPITFNHLCKNIKENHLTNISAYNFALGNREDTVYFIDHTSDRLLNNSGGMHCLTTEDINCSRKSSYLLSKEHKSQMYRLDAVDIDNFDLLVIDAEGTEFELLLGAKSKIEKNKPIIITEIWNNNKRKEENLSTSCEDVFELLYSYGYVYESFGKARKNDFCFLPTEFINITNSKHKYIINA